jgi:hypothetical protein
MPRKLSLIANLLSTTFHKRDSEARDIPREVWIGATSKKTWRAAVRNFSWVWLLGIVAFLGVGGLPTAGRTVVYQGVYAIVNPYSSTDAADLAAASGVACPQPPTSTIASAFCGTSLMTQSPIVGVYLRVQWCDFELYHSGSSPPKSCHYIVSPSPNNMAFDITGTQSTCNVDTSGYTDYPFDTCNSSVLYQTLQSLVMINALRKNAGLPKLLISVGMIAGAAAPLSYLLTAPPIPGTEAMPAGVNGTNGYCVRLPSPWTSSYISGYETAKEQLIHQINTYASGALSKSIKIVKVTPFNVASNELDMDGRYIFMPGGIDPTAPGGPYGTPISCPLRGDAINNGAGLWLSAYNSLYGTTAQGGTMHGPTGLYPDCYGYPSMSQGSECVLGSTVGFIRSYLKTTPDNVDMSATLIAIPTNGTTALPDVDCGVDGASGCSTATSSNDQSKIYYFYDYIDHLFTSGTVAYTNASMAYAANGAIGTYSLAATQLGRVDGFNQHQSARKTDDG